MGKSIGNGDGMEQDVQELDVKELFLIILSRWYVIAIAVMIGLSLSWVYAFFVLDDVYATESSMIVLVDNEDNNQMTNFTYGQRLVDTYTELAKSEQVIDRLDALGLPYSRSQFKSMISLSGVKDTVVIKLTTTGHNEEDITLIANETMLAIQELSTHYEGFDNIEILDMAKVPLYPSGPNRMLYVAIGLVLGGMVGVGSILLFEFADTSIKTTKDIERKLQLRVLSVIPDYQHEELA